MAGPLEGIRVLDACVRDSGSLAAKFLGDMGADVLKVESPHRSDPVRGVDRPSSTDGLNYVREGQDRNKRSITLDLEHPDGLAVCYRLVKEAIVFMHDFRPNVAESLRVDYRTLAEIDAGLVYGWHTDSGERGPQRDRVVTDIVGQAWSGLLTIYGSAEAPPQPIPASVSVADSVGAIVFAHAITIAIFHRLRTGKGQKVVTSQLGSLMMAQSSGIMNHLLAGSLPPRESRLAVNSPLYNTYRGQDGRWFIVAVAQPDRYWHDFCAVAGLPELADDPRFSSIEGRQAHINYLVGILDEAFSKYPAAVWIERLMARQVLCGPIHDYADLVADTQVRENRYVREYDHPTAGRITVPGIPIQLEATPGDIRRPAPEYGEHTEEVLLEAGFSREEIAGLRCDGVI